jgi:hypothetical protein
MLLQGAIYFASFNLFLIIKELVTIKLGPCRLCGNELFLDLSDFQLELSDSSNQYYF